MVGTSAPAGRHWSVPTGGGPRGSAAQAADRDDLRSKTGIGPSIGCPGAMTCPSLTTFFSGRLVIHVQTKNRSGMAELVGFNDFVDARSTTLLRTAWLLTGDWHLSEDLVQTALAKTARRWAHIQRRDAPEVYVRRVLVTTFLSWRAKRSSHEVPTALFDSAAAIGSDLSSTDLRVALIVAVRQLPRQQRAVIALRYFIDLSESETATAMRCSVGTVKSHTSRALAHLRGDPALVDLFTEESV